MSFTNPITWFLFETEAGDRLLARLERFLGLGLDRAGEEGPRLPGGIPLVGTLSDATTPDDFRRFYQEAARLCRQPTADRAA